MRRVLGAVLALLMTACASSGTSGGPPRVVAAFYPLAYLAERIGGETVVVTDLTPPGAEPHDIELRPSQAELLSTADLTLYVKGFQPAVDAAARGDRAFDLRVGNDPDPHVWLDPVRYRELSTAVAERMATLWPAHAAAIRARGVELASELVSLDAEFKTGLADCDRKTIFTSHAAFGHLTRRYGLNQVGITGLSPDQEPSPTRLAEVVRFARTNKVTTIFFESLVSPKLAQTVASEIGARTAVLDPIESKPAGGDYTTAMRANLAALRTALSCR